MTSGAARDRRRAGRASPSRLTVAGVAAMIVVVAACGSSKPSAAEQAEQKAFLAQVHSAVPTIQQLRSDSQLVRLGEAVCSVFSTGVSYQVLADRMSEEDGNIPTSVLGTVITAAGEHLCPKYSSLVS